MTVRSDHQKVTGSAAGKTGQWKKDGYAKGPVPTSMRGTKEGKTTQVDYSGPNVEKHNSHRPN